MSDVADRHEQEVVRKPAQDKSCYAIVRECIQSYEGTGFVLWKHFHDSEFPENLALYISDWLVELDPVVPVDRRVGFYKRFMQSLQPTLSDLFPHHTGVPTVFFKSEGFESQADAYFSTYFISMAITCLSRQKGSADRIVQSAQGYEQQQLKQAIGDLLFQDGMYQPQRWTWEWVLSFVPAFIWEPPERAFIRDLSELNGADSKKDLLSKFRGIRQRAEQTLSDDSWLIKKLTEVSDKVSISASQDIIPCVAQSQQQKSSLHTEVLASVPKADLAEGDNSAELHSDSGSDDELRSDSPPVSSPEASRSPSMEPASVPSSVKKGEFDLCLQKKLDEEAQRQKLAEQQQHDTMFLASGGATAPSAIPRAAISAYSFNFSLFLSMMMPDCLGLGFEDLDFYLATLLNITA